MSDSVWFGNGDQSRGIWILYDGDGREWLWWAIRLGWCGLLSTPFAWAPWPAGGPRLFLWMQGSWGKGIAVVGLLVVWRLVRMAAEAFTCAVQAKGWRRTKASGAYWFVAVFFLPFLLQFQLVGTMWHWRSWSYFELFSLSLLLAFMLLLELFVSLRRVSEARELAEDMAQRSRLEPHFLFNVLNDIQAQIPTDPSAAAAALARVGHLMRSVISLSEKPMVPLEEELAFVESYLGLQKLRLGSRLRVVVDVPEDVEPLLVPTLALHTLVDNALKHGLARRAGGGELRIWARAEPRYEAFKTFHDLILGVENDVADANLQSAPEGTGTGLPSLRTRLQNPEDLQVGMEGTKFRATLKWRQS